MTLFSTRGVARGNENSSRAARLAIKSDDALNVAYRLASEESTKKRKADTEEPDDASLSSPS